MHEGTPGERLARGTRVRVTLKKARPPDIEYPAVVIADDGSDFVVEASWSEDAERDLGFVRFEPGDVFTEHYWRDRWYSIKDVRDRRGARKGWYCDVARPARVRSGAVVSDDLELDLWVSGDGETVLRLDEDEFAAGGLEARDPAAAASARRALDELERMARAGMDSALR